MKYCKPVRAAILPQREMELGLYEGCLHTATGGLSSLVNKESNRPEGSQCIVHS